MQAISNPPFLDVSLPHHGGTRHSQFLRLYDHTLAHYHKKLYILIIDKISGIQYRCIVRFSQLRGSSGITRKHSVPMVALDRHFSTLSNHPANTLWSVSSNRIVEATYRRFYTSKGKQYFVFVPLHSGKDNMIFVVASHFSGDYTCGGFRCRECSVR